MGNKESKPSVIPYEEALKRVSEDELKRLREAFKRYSIPAGYMSKLIFVKDVMGDAMPQKLGEHLFFSFGGTNKGITFKDLFCGLVMLTRGRQAEKLRYGDFVGCFSQICLNFDYKVQIPVSMTPDACIQGCKDSGFQVAAVYNYSGCACACEQTCSARHRLDNGCGLPCRNDPRKRFCGGYTAANVYKVDLQNAPNIKCDRPTPTEPEKDIEYIGCFAQSCLEFDYTVNTAYDENSPASCTSACREGGFSIASLYNRSTCSCSCLHSCTKPVLPNEYCGLPCPGKSPHRCGGFTSASVYRVKTVSKSNVSCSEPENVSDGGGRKSTIAISITITILIIIGIFVVIFIILLRIKVIKSPIPKGISRSSHSSFMVRYWMSFQRRSYRCNIQRGTASRHARESIPVSSEPRSPTQTPSRQACKAPPSVHTTGVRVETHCVNNSIAPWTAQSSNEIIHEPEAEYQYPDQMIGTGSNRLDLEGQLTDDEYDYVGFQNKDTHLKSSMNSGNEIGGKSTLLISPRFSAMNYCAVIHSSGITEAIHQENNRGIVDCEKYEVVDNPLNVAEPPANDFRTSSREVFDPEPHYPETCISSIVNNDRSDATSELFGHTQNEVTLSSHLDESFDNDTSNHIDDTKLKKREVKDGCLVSEVPLPIDVHMYNVRINTPSNQDILHQDQRVKQGLSPHTSKTPLILPKPPSREHAINETQESSCAEAAEELYNEAHYEQTLVVSSLNRGTPRPRKTPKAPSRPPEREHAAITYVTGEPPERSAPENLYSEAHYEQTPVASSLNQGTPRPRKTSKAPRRHPKQEHAAITYSTGETPERSAPEDFYSEAHYGQTSYLASSINRARPDVSEDYLIPEQDHLTYISSKKVLSHLQSSPITSQISKDGYLVPELPSP